MTDRVGAEGFNPFLEPVRADPYPTYAQLRRDDPVHRSDVLDAWVITRHAEAEQVLRDHATFSSVRTKGRTVMRGSLVFSDPPQHTRLRGLVNKAFTTQVVEALRPRIRHITDGLLDALMDRAHIDLIEDFAYPLPVIVIAELLGVPVQDRDAFRAWASGMAASMDHIGGGTAMTGGAGLPAYLSDIVSQRRAEPRDDLISRMLHAGHDGDCLDHAELVTMCVVLLFAGHETTVNTIGNGMLALLRDPDQIQRLREQPALMRRGVEELLRYDSPLQITRRTVTADTRLGGRDLRAGDAVVVVVGAANRDPDVFADPETLDLGRSPNPHLTFGHGIHFCVGAPLARAEAQIALGTLLERFADIRPAGEPLRRDTVTLRGLQTLPVRLRSA